MSIKQFFIAFLITYFLSMNAAVKNMTAGAIAFFGSTLGIVSCICKVGKTSKKV